MSGNVMGGKGDCCGGGCANPTSDLEAKDNLESKVDASTLNKNYN